uniref:Uncharacterized protein n=1 Tax=Trichogramma kaykai TaxID=54128 RepID=A0ABD2VVE2_9HYME
MLNSSFTSRRYIFTPNTGCGSGGGGGDATAATVYIRFAGVGNIGRSSAIGSANFAGLLIPPSDKKFFGRDRIRGYRQGSSCSLQSFFGPLAYVAVQLVSLPARCVCSLTIRHVILINRENQPYMPSSSRPLYGTQTLEGYCTRVILEFDVCRFLVPASRLSAV